MAVAIASDVNASILLSYQRGTFFYLGRFWCFYTANLSDGIFYGHRSSTDGITWTDFAKDFACESSARNQVFLDEHTGLIHAVLLDSTADDISYLRGQLFADGTAEWTYDAVIVAATAGVELDYPSICVDSNGYPWIAYSRTESGNTYPYVIKSSRNDVWATETGFPIQLSTTSQVAWTTLMVPLTNGEVYILYGNTDTAPFGRLWNGSMGDEETASSRVNKSYPSIVASPSGDVYIAFLATAAPTNDIIISKRTYATSTWADTTVQADVDGIGGICVGLTYLVADNNMVCCWFDSAAGTANHLYYKKWNGTAWDAAATDAVTISENIVSDNYLNVSANDGGGVVSIMTQTGAGLSFKIWHYFLSVGKPVFMPHGGL